MLALVTRGPGVVELVDVAEPEPAGNEVLLSVDAVGVCGTDAHLWAGEYARGVLPCIQGHEIAATVLALPRDGGHRGLTVGTRVVVDPTRSCGTCHACAVGRPHACRDMSVLGVHRDGGLCERMAVPVDRTVPVGDLPQDVTPLAEPMSIAMHAVARSRAVEGEWVLVIGAGPIGLLATARLHELGARVVAVDREPGRVAAARACGAVAGHVAGPRYPGPGQSDELAELTAGHGPAVVVEATGAPACLTAATELVAPAGRVVAVGISDATTAFPMSVLAYKEIDLLGSRNGGELLPRAVDFLARNAATVRPLLTHRFPLTAAEEAFRHAGGGPQVGEVGKVVVEVAAR